MQRAILLSFLLAALLAAGSVARQAPAVDSVGLTVSDLVAILGSIDYVLADIDR